MPPPDHGSEEALGSTDEAAEAIDEMARSIKVREQEKFRHFREIPIERLLVCFVVRMGPSTVFFKRELMLSGWQAIPLWQRRLVRMSAENFLSIS